ASLACRKKLSSHFTSQGQSKLCSGQSGQVLVARLTAPESGLKFQARALVTAIGTPSVTLNGKKLTSDYQPILATDQYYLGYQQHGQQTGNITESGSAETM
ncbi:MAG: hypothetical protein ACRC6P_17625, partial [Shewanella oncorhynchi]